MSDVLRDPCIATEAIEQKPVAACPQRAQPWILLATILGSSMAFIDGSVVNMVLPLLQKEMNASATQAQWLIESYALFLAALILVGGSLGDLYGHRRVFVVGVIGFSIASLLCGIAQTANQLIFMRALQGIGGALLVPGSLAIISANFDESRRGAAIGTWSAATALTMAVGPVLGAWLADNFSWRWIFFMNIPLAIIILLVVAWRVPETKRADCKPLDKTGAVLGTMSLGLLTFALIESNRYGLLHPLIVLTLCTGIIALALFIRQQLRHRFPIMPLSLFKSRNFSGANAMTFFLYSALGGAFFFMPFFLINIQGYSTTQAAAAFLPFIIVMSVFSRYAGMLSDRYGTRLPMTLGPLITSAGYGLLAITGADADYWSQLFPAILLQGIGMTITVAPLTTTVMNAVDQPNLGIASGINNMVSRTAGLLAVAIFGILFLNSANQAYEEVQQASALNPALLQTYFSGSDFLAPPAIANESSTDATRTITAVYEQIFLSAFRTIMLVAAALAILSGVISGLTITRRPASPHVIEKQ